MKNHIKNIISFLKSTLLYANNHIIKVFHPIQIKQFSIPKQNPHSLYEVNYHKCMLIKIKINEYSLHNNKLNHLRYSIHYKNRVYCNFYWMCDYSRCIYLCSNSKFCKSMTIIIKLETLKFLWRVNCESFKK